MSQRSKFDPMVAAYWLRPEALKTVSAPLPLDTDLRNLARCMLAIMYNARAVGIAANQLGVAVRVIGLATPQFTGVIANPEIETRGMKMPSHEGCLSFPDEKAVINRYAGVKLRGFHIHPATYEWMPITITLGGISAFAAQHEVDHLNGVTIKNHPDRLPVGRQARRVVSSRDRHGHQ